MTEQTNEGQADKRSAKGSGKTKLYAPTQLLIPELDGPIAGLSDEERARIDKLDPAEQLKALAPARVKGLLAHFAADAHACAMIESQLDDRAVQPLDPSFHVSCQSGVHEPVIVTDLGNMPDGSPAILVVEGRQRVRSLRIWNHARASENPPRPPLALNCVVRTFASPRKAREVRIVTSNFVQLSPLQRAERAQELLDDGVAPADVMPIVGVSSKAAFKSLLDILTRPEEVRDAVGSGAVSASALRDMRHLSAQEVKARTGTIVRTGAKGRKARAIARTGQADAEVTKAPARSVLDALAKRLAGSSDPILAVCGAIVVFATTGKDAGLDRVPGLREIVGEELRRYHGAALTDAERAKLSAWVDANGGPNAAAEKAGIASGTLAKALVGAKVKSRVRVQLAKLLQGG